MIFEGCVEIQNPIQGSTNVHSTTNSETLIIYISDYNITTVIFKMSLCSNFLVKYTYINYKVKIKISNENNRPIDLNPKKLKHQKVMNFK